MLPVQSVAAGTSGSPYRAIVTTSKTNSGTPYVINDTNFPGIGKYLPCYVMVLGATPANVQLQASINNGSAWLNCGGAGGGMIYADAAGVTGSAGGVSTTATAAVLVSTATTNVHILPLAAS